jgi:hypothetical protein
MNEVSAATVPIIDIHRTAWPTPLPAPARSPRTVLRLRTGLRQADAHPAMTVNGITSVLYPELTDLDRQIREQDAAGITKSLLSFSMALEVFCQVLHLRAAGSSGEVPARCRHQHRTWPQLSPRPCPRDSLCEREGRFHQQSSTDHAPTL